MIADPIFQLARRWMLFQFDQQERAFTREQFEAYLDSPRGREIIHRMVNDLWREAERQQGRAIVAAARRKVTDLTFCEMINRRVRQLDPTARVPVRRYRELTVRPPRRILSSGRSCRRPTLVRRQRGRRQRAARKTARAPAGAPSGSSSDPPLPASRIAPAEVRS
jgi:hypothetical protein